MALLLLMLEVFKFYMEFVTIIPSFTIYNITRECQINDAVYNGTRLMDVGKENFMLTDVGSRYDLD